MGDVLSGGKNTNTPYQSFFNSAGLDDAVWNVEHPEAIIPERLESFGNQIPHHGKAFLETWIAVCTQQDDPAVRTTYHNAHFIPRVVDFYIRRSRKPGDPTFKIQSDTEERFRWREGEDSAQGCLLGIPWFREFRRSILDHGDVTGSLFPYKFV